jgi:hypothetical protein
MKSNIPRSSGRLFMSTCRKDTLRRNSSSDINPCAFSWAKDFACWLDFTQPAALAFSKSRSVARISRELGQPLSTVKRVGANLSRSYRWDELEELLQVLGPLPMDELSRIWIPDAGRHVGGYVRDGYLRRGPAGLELTGKRPGRPGP